MFSPEFKGEQIARVERGEVTLAELSRELEVYPSVVRRWKQRFDQGALTAVGADDAVVPARLLREAEGRIRELERALGRKAMEVEILRAGQQEVKKDGAGTAGPSRHGTPDEPGVPDAGGEAEHGVPPRRASVSFLPAAGGRGGAGSDPVGGSGAGHLRAPAGHGGGEKEARRTTGSRSGG